MKKDPMKWRINVESTRYLEVKKHPEWEGGFSETRTSARSWMWRSACIKDVTVWKSWSNLCFETEQFLRFDMWTELTNTSQKRHKKYPLRTLICSSAQGNLWQRLSEDGNLLWICLPIQFLSMKKMDRHWYTTIRSQLFWSVEIHDQNFATQSVNSSKNW